MTQAQRPDELLMDLLCELGRLMSVEIHGEVCRTPSDELAAVDRESEDDTIYVIDQRIEEHIIAFFEKRVRPVLSVALVMEGTPGEALVFGGSGRRADAEFTVLMDPLDGTRGLMYGKRSAWLLTGAAHGADPGLTLRDIMLAVQTEIPPPKQQLADQLRAVRGGGAEGARCDLATGTAKPLAVVPSRAKRVRDGFVTFNRFFPAAKDAVTTVEMELARRIDPDGDNGLYFEDQYICNGGQLAQLAMGQDRFVCDLRGIISPVLEARGRRPLIATHPYDICTEMIAREAGAIVTDTAGNPLAAPLDTTTNVAWVGYANEHIRRLIEPPLLDILSKIGDFVP